MSESRKVGKSETKSESRKGFVGKSETGKVDKSVLNQPCAGDIHGRDRQH
jgi:hypothetical protein